MPEDRARRADGVRVGVSDERAGRSGEARDDVDPEVAEVAEVPSTGAPSQPEREQFNAMCTMFPCRNAAVISRHQSPARDRRPVQDPVVEQLAAGVFIPKPCATVIR